VRSARSRATCLLLGLLASWLTRPAPMLHLETAGWRWFQISPRNERPSGRRRLVWRLASGVSSGEQYHSTRSEATRRLFIGSLHGARCPQGASGTPGGKDRRRGGDGGNMGDGETAVDIVARTGLASQPSPGDWRWSMELEHGAGAWSWMEHAKGHGAWSMSMHLHTPHTCTCTRTSTPPTPAARGRNRDASR
jgi:hypothetical protein